MNDGYPSMKEAYDARKTFQKSGDQMVNNMTPSERLTKGLPMYSLSDNEKRRLEHRYTEAEQQALDRSNKKILEDNAREAKKIEEKIYLGYYEDWPTDLKEKLRKEWLFDHTFMNRKEQYKSLINNSVEPWSKINNCTSMNPINPDDPEITTFDKDQYYNFIVPECGIVWKWYNTPGADLGTTLQQGRLYSKYFPSIPTEAHIVIDKGAKTIKNEILKPLEIPFYFSAVAGVIMLIAIAVIKVG